MSDAQTYYTWQQTDTAQHYQNFTQTTTMYQDLSQALLNLAQINPDMRVLDLGCGTGVTSQAILSQLDSTGCLYAVDMSTAMLNLARQNLENNQRATFLLANAESFVQLIPEPVDRVICNSVFWQIHNKPKMLAELRQVLKPDGLFIFNVPEPYFIFKHIPRSPKVAVLFKQLAAERYGVGPQDMRTIKVFLEHHQFKLLKMKSFERTRTADESYQFMQLPVSTAWMEPPLDYQTRMDLLHEAHQLADLSLTSTRRWMCFVAKPA